MIAHIIVIFSVVNTSCQGLKIKMFAEGWVVYRRRVGPQSQPGMRRAAQSCDHPGTRSCDRLELHIRAQVYRLSAAHCQMTRYSQRVPGYSTRYSVSANEISFDKKISQSDCVFQIRLGLKENDFPSPPRDFNSFLRPNWRIIPNMTLKHVFF